MNQLVRSINIFVLGKDFVDPSRLWQLSNKYTMTILLYFFRFWQRRAETFLVSSFFFLLYFLLFNANATKLKKNELINKRDGASSMTFKEM